MAKLRILLGDDHNLVRTGLKKILEARRDWTIVAEAADGREAVRLATELTPDVAVLDIGMPILNGIEATRQIVRRSDSIRVLILSMHANDAYVARALEAGATGYMLKDSADTDLMVGVETVASGTPYFSPAVSALMTAGFQQHGNAARIDRYDSLSERERQIFQLVAEGRSNKAVAELLSISPTTVETHRARIFQKLDVHSGAELVIYAMRRGLIA